MTDKVKPRSLAWIDTQYNTRWKIPAWRLEVRYVTVTGARRAHWREREKVLVGAWIGPEVTVDTGMEC